MHPFAKHAAENEEDRGNRCRKGRRVGRPTSRARYVPHFLHYMPNRCSFSARRKVMAISLPCYRLIVPGYLYPLHRSHRCFYSSLSSRLRLPHCKLDDFCSLHHFPISIPQFLFPMNTQSDNPHDPLSSHAFSSSSSESRKFMQIPSLNFLSPTICRWTTALLYQSSYPSPSLLIS